VSTFCGQHSKLLNVKSDDTHRYHSDLKINQFKEQCVGYQMFSILFEWGTEFPLRISEMN